MNEASENANSLSQAEWLLIAIRLAFAGVKLMGPPYAELCLCDDPDGDEMSPEVRKMLRLILKVCEESE